MDGTESKEDRVCDVDDDDNEEEEEVVVEEEEEEEEDTGGCGGGGGPPALTSAACAPEATWFDRNRRFCFECAEQQVPPHREHLIVFLSQEPDNCSELEGQQGEHEGW